ncbi:unnamed protein product [Paramecium sonneborni]|uniref:Uncharacterized protein n=1 Tax=Paramecium sonneborni TaxID=65129 RepID=A0A8S1MRD9_9CILI|nr:unnamed protein product [Paramecium sonneborni]
MRQSKICQQQDCKKIFYFLDDKGPNIRCKNCHSQIFQQSINEIQQKKSQLLMRKNQLQQEFQKYFQKNKQKWDEGVQQSLNTIKEAQIKEKQYKLAHNVNTRKSYLAFHQEELDNQKQFIEQLQNLSKSIQEKYQNLKQSVKQKQKEIQMKAKQVKYRQYIIFAQLPFLFDNHMFYKQYRINYEIQETFYDTIQDLSSYEDTRLLSTSFYNLDYEQQRLSTPKINVRKGEICLTFKKSTAFWKEYFHDNLQYYENFITSIIKVYKLIYYLANLFNIVLPYVIQIDNNGFPQFLEYEIFSQKKISNLVDLKESSLSQMQINIYYLKYYFNIDIQDKLYSYFDIIDLLQSFYYKLEFHEFNDLEQLINYYIPSENNQIIKEQNKNQQKRKGIPIKLVQTQYPKFLLKDQIQEQQIITKMESVYEFSDVEFIQ